MASSPLLTAPLTPEGDTCLHWAFASDHVDMIVLLASLAANNRMIKSVNNAGQTPLITTCRADHGFVIQGVIRALVGLGANVNTNYLVKRMVPSRSKYSRRCFAKPK
jgi:ankyrin repeat protein